MVIIITTEREGTQKLYNLKVPPTAAEKVLADEASTIFHSVWFQPKTSGCMGETDRQTDRQTDRDRD